MNGVHAHDEEKQFRKRLYALMAAGEPEIAHLSPSDPLRQAWWKASEWLANIMCSAAND